MELSPPLKRSQFTNLIAKDLSGFKEWIFCPGMLFRSDQKWWGDRGKRGSTHEGLDLFLYRNNKGESLRLDENTKVPAIYDGTVIRVIDDFLGRSIFMEHGGGFFTALGHTRPLEGIEVGTEIKEGDIIATIAKINDPGLKIAPHLHITAGWISEDLDYEKLDWDTTGNSNMIILVDPLDTIDIDSGTLEDYPTECIDL